MGLIHSWDCNNILVPEVLGVDALRLKCVDINALPLHFHKTGFCGDNVISCSNSQQDFTSSLKQYKSD